MMEEVKVTRIIGKIPRWRVIQIPLIVIQTIKERLRILLLNDSLDDSVLYRTIRSLQRKYSVNVVYLNDFVPVDETIR